jgi:ribosomal protein S18 acetylase RimI-like enzyme
MNPFEQIVIAPLNTALHDRTGFRCGIEALDIYLRKQAGQDIKRRISRVFVATTPQAPKTVVGYYTLRALSVALCHLPAESARKLPRHPVPAALIGRLAVSLAARKHGIGKMLLADAIQRTLAVSDQIAVYAMVVDAINEEAIGFYEQFGFIRLHTGRTRLFLPLISFFP